MKEALVTCVCTSRGTLVVIGRARRFGRFGRFGISRWRSRWRSSAILMFSDAFGCSPEFNAHVDNDDDDTSVP